MHYFSNLRTVPRLRLTIDVSIDGKLAAGSVAPATVAGYTSMDSKYKGEVDAYASKLAESLKVVLVSSK